MRISTTWSGMESFIPRLHKDLEDTHLSDPAEKNARPDLANFNCCLVSSCSSKRIERIRQI